MTDHYGMALYQVLGKSVANALKMNSEEKFNSSIMLMILSIYATSGIKITVDVHKISSRLYRLCCQTKGLRGAVTTY